jgi:uncharacterized protein involved in oxidation of intracellular sulfur
METFTIIVNDPPYGTERTWNALRLAEALLVGEAQVRIFLLGDAVSAAKQGQATPKGYYNLEQMLQKIIERGATVKACGSCLQARGLNPEELVSGVEPGRMLELAAWTKESEKVIAF